jgi:hypothetical protein
VELPDYVFDAYFGTGTIDNPTYKILSLEEVENFAKENRHLPRVPSEAEITKDGSMNLQGMLMAVLEKVEELFVYVFDINDKVNAQQAVIQQQQVEIQQLQKDVQALQQK